jgi:hypothetical protein
MEENMRYRFRIYKVEWMDVHPGDRTSLRQRLVGIVVLDQDDAIVALEEYARRAAIHPARITTATFTMDVVGGGTYMAELHEIEEVVA